MMIATTTLRASLAARASTIRTAWTPSLTVTLEPRFQTRQQETTKSQKSLQVELFACKKNLALNAFQSRTQQVVISNLLHDNLSVSARFPQGVRLDGCENATIKIPNKVASVTILSCNSCKIIIHGVISRIEAIRCNKCTIYIAGPCPTLTLDNCHTSEIEFELDKQPTLLCVSHTSPHTTIKAKSDICNLHSIYEVPQLESKDEEQSATSQSSSSGPRQIVSRFADGHFTSELLKREDNGYTNF